MLFSQKLNSRRIFKRLAKALISLRICAGWSEPLLVAHNTCWKSRAAAQYCKHVGIMRMIYRGSYMSAHVFIDFIKRVGEKR